MAVIFEHASYKVIKEENVRQGAKQLLSKIIYGTDGPLYQHADALEKVNHIIRPLSFTIEKEETTIGTCTFLERDIQVEGKIYKAWYSRYFAIAPENQGKIFGNLLLKSIKNYFEAVTDTPTVFYGYVDNANPRSRRILKHTGLEIIRGFETLAFSRVFPKKDNRVTRILEHDKQQVLELLKEQYKNYVFVNFEPLFLHNNYFVLKSNNDIIAGIRANITKWKICHMPGLLGKILMKLLPHTPILSRIFNPNDFSFLAFEGIYCKPGYEKELFVLMESVCAELKFYSGMLWIDPKSELYDRIKDAGSWGIMNKLKDHIPVNVLAAFRNIPKQEQDAFRNNPAYISSFDMT